MARDASDQPAATAGAGAAAGRAGIPPALEARALERVRACLDRDPQRLLIVSSADQRLWLVAGGRLREVFTVSTAARGVGGAEGSRCTPPGTHRIEQRIGAGCAPGTVFESREPTGRVWRGEPEVADLILTRILTLRGCEPGVNQGPGCDSLARYIYIHGTNHEQRLGSPASQGCIRLASRDVIRLFERVREGDAVVIL